MFASGVIISALAFREAAATTAIKAFKANLVKGFEEGGRVIMFISKVLFAYSRQGLKLVLRIACP